MAQKTITELLVEAALIKNETSVAANTANRVGSTLEDIIDSFKQFRGNWTTTNALPSTGGRYTGGVPAAGDEYHLPNGLFIGSNNYPPGTIAKSLVNGPASISDWVFYSMQAIF